MGLSGVRSNSISISSILPACSSLKYLYSGREIHGFTMRNGMGDNVFVSSGIVDIYTNCLSLKQAQFVLDNMGQRDVVSWNVILMAYFSNGEGEKVLDLFCRMITEGVMLNFASWNSIIGGCIQNGKIDKALKLLAEMQNSGFKANRITISTVLPTCTDLESMRIGKEIHAYSLRNQFAEDIMVGTALVFMCAKCEDLELSGKVFNMLVRRDTVAWNTMILASSTHGNGEEDWFVLSCSGCVEEAYEFIYKMPIDPTAGAWGALLGACRIILRDPLRFHHFRDGVCSCRDFWLYLRQFHFNYITPDRTRHEMLRTKTPLPSEHWPFIRGHMVGQVVMCFSDFVWDVSTIRNTLLIVEWTFCGNDGFSRFMPFGHHLFQVDVTIDLGDHIFKSHRFVEENVLFSFAVELESVAGRMYIWSLQVESETIRVAPPADLWRTDRIECG
ncbi:hypothetical protein GIB67_015484 [Kingdonia uniflora]|uniref:DYW domain-containing protein n=1 Tax=Kingdonia uniflora TaxID=39325 RepID=A0A7J7LA53_9MAGN|nr:hypothetical protein GIB67_015484 [Kingdonia uniflora]